MKSSNQYPAGANFSVELRLIFDMDEHVFHAAWN